MIFIPKLRNKNDDSETHKSARQIVVNEAFFPAEDKKDAVSFMSFVTEEGQTVYAFLTREETLDIMARLAENIKK